jgi:uncharacterized repeat protein (TIGR02543 family)
MANVNVTATFAIDTFTLDYAAGTGGSLTGDTSQVVDYGQDGTAVTAVPDTGYHFVDWSDGSTANPRTDTNVMANVNVTATFAVDTFTLDYAAGADGSMSGDTSQVVDYGQDGTAVTAVPDTGYHFVDWSDGSTANPRTDTNVTADVNVTATFAINTYTLDYVAGTGGSLTGDASQVVNYGADGTAVTAVPDTGYHFVDWSDGSTANPRTDTNITADVDVTANFEEIPPGQYVLAAYTAGSGSVTLNPAGGVYDEGTDVNLTAVPAAGWTFDHWSGNLTGSDNPATITIDGDKSVTAHFTQDTYVLTVTPSGDGSVAVDPAGPYTYGDEVELTATADPGWTFDHWSGDLTGSDNPATITMDEDKTITATFTQDEYTLTVSAEGDGSVSKDPDQTSYHYGDEVELTATADPGWTFDHWSGDLAGSDNPATITMDGDKTVTAHFTQDEYTLTVSAEGDGSVGKDPDQTSYHYGDEVELTATADTGWTFDHWSGDLTGSDNPATITIDEDKTITATFTEEGGGTPLFHLFLPCIATDHTPAEGDSNPPDSRVSRLGSVQYNPAFTVGWTESTPGGSGIECYDVQFKDGPGSWEDWRTCTTDTSARFYGQPGHVHYFRSRATDNAGNVEAWPSEPDTRTVVRAWAWW